MGRRGRQADGTAGLRSALEIAVRLGTYASCQEATSCDLPDYQEFPLRPLRIYLIYNLSLYGWLDFNFNRTSRDA